MNKIFRVVFNAATGTWVAVSELVKSQGKTKTETQCQSGDCVKTKALSALKLTGIAFAVLGGSNAMAFTPDGSCQYWDSGYIYCGTGITSGTPAASGGQEVLIGYHISSDYIAKDSNPQNVIFGAEAAGADTRDVVVGRGAMAESYSTEVLGTKNTEAGQSTAIGAYTKVLGAQALAVGTSAYTVGDSAITIGTDNLDNAWSSLKEAFPDIYTTDKPSVAGAGYYIDQKLQEYGVNDSTRKTLETINISGNATTTLDVSSATATNQYSPTTATGAASVAVGASAIAANTSSLAFGATSLSSGVGSVAMGLNATSTDRISLAVGTAATSNAAYAVAVGAYSDATAANSMAWGSNATASGKDAIAIGTNTIASGDGATAIGNCVSVSGKNAIAYGSFITSTDDDSVILGNSSTGTGSNPIANETSTTIDGVTYGNFSGTVSGTGEYVSVGSNETDGQRKVINVAAGTISADSTEGINGSQLYSVVSSLQDGTMNVSATGILHVTTTVEADENGAPITTYNISADAVPGDFESEDISVDSSTGKANDAKSTTTDVTSASTANAINDSYFTMTAQDAEGNAVDGASNYQVKTGTTVNYLAGNNTQVTQTGSTINFALDDNVTFAGVNITTGGINMSGKTITGLPSIVNGQDLSSITDNATLHNAASVADLQDAATQTKELLDSTQMKVVEGENTVVQYDPDTNTYKVGFKSADSPTVKIDSLGQAYIVEDKVNATASLTEGDLQVLGNDSFFNVNVTGNNTVMYGSAVGKDANGESAHVHIGDTMTYSAGKYINIEQTPTTTTAVDDDGNTVTYNGTSYSFTFEPGDNFVLGSSGSNGTNGSLTVNGSDGSGVAIDGKTGQIGLKGPKGSDGANGASANLTFKQGSPGLDGKDGVTRLVYTYTDADGNSVEEQAATLNDDGFNFKGNDDTVVAKKLNEELTIKGGAAADATAASGNMYVESDGSELTVKMNQDLQNLNSAKFGTGDSVVEVTKDGITIPSDQQTTPVSLTSNGLSNGNQTITNLGSGISSGNTYADCKSDADCADLDNMANLGDLKDAVSDALKNAASGGFNLATKADGGVVTGTSQTVAVQNTNTVTHIAGDNMVIEQDGTNLTYSLSDNLVFNTSGDDGTNGGLVTVENADGTSQVAVDGTNGTIGLPGATGSDGQSVMTNITIVKGPAGVDGTDQKDRVVYTPGNESTQTVATLNDGLKFAGNDVDSDGNAVTANVPLNDTLTLKGGATDDESKTTANYRVDNDGSGNLLVNMTTDLTDLDSAQFTDDQGHTTTIDKDGVTVSGGTNDVKLTDSGLDNGNNKVTDTAKGLDDGKDIDTLDPTADKDTLEHAATVADLESVYKEVVTADGGGGFGLADENGKTVTADLGKTIPVVGDGGAISTSVENGKLKVSLSDNLNVGSTGDDGTDGKVTVQGSGGEDGASVVINGKDGTIGLTGPKGDDGKDGASVVLGVETGTPGLNGKDGQPAEDKTRIYYTDGDGNKDELATLNDGMHFAGNNVDSDGNPTTVDVALNGDLTIKGGVADTVSDDDLTDKNIRINTTSGAMVVEMATSLTDLDSATFSDGTNTTVINKDGVTVSGGKNGDVKLTDSSLDNGNNKVTDTASGLGCDSTGDNCANIDKLQAGDSTLTNAATVADLQSVVKSIVSADQGGGFGLADDSGDTVKADLGKTIPVVGDGNAISTSVEDGKLKVSLSDNVNVGSTGDDGTDGKVTVQGSGGEDGASVVINGKDGTIGLTGPKGDDGKDGASVVLGVETGTPGLNGKDGQPAEDKTRIYYTDGDGNKDELATLNDGMHFAGNNVDSNGNPTTVDVALNGDLTIKGGVADTVSDDDLTDKNIRINTTSGAMVVEMATSLTDLDSATFSDGTNTTVINKDGVTVSGGKNGDVTLTDKGLDNGNNQVTDTASGLGCDTKQGCADLDTLQDGDSTLTNAATVADLKEMVNEVISADAGGGFGLKDDEGDEITANLGTQIDVIGDGSITTSVSNNQLVVGLSNTVSVGTVAKDGASGSDGKVTVVDKDGDDQVSIDGAHASIVLNGVSNSDGTPSASANITVNSQGSAGLTQGDTTKNRLTYTDSDGNTNEMATLNDGLHFVGNNKDANGNLVSADVDLNGDLTVKGGMADTSADAVTDKNIRVNTTSGDMVVEMAKDLTDLNSATFTDDKGHTTKVTKDGITITGGPNGDVSLTETGLDNGDNVISNTASGLGGQNIDDIADGDSTLTNAATVGDLKTVVNSVVSADAGGGFGLSDADGDTVKADLGKTVNISGDGSIVTSVNDDGQIQVGLSDNVSIGSGKDGQDGKLTVQGAAGQDGASVVINGADGTIGLTGPKGDDGKDGVSATLGVQDGTPTLDGADGEDGTSTRLIYTTPNSTTPEELATMNDGLKFAGNTGDTITTKLNETLTVKGGLAADQDTTDQNIRIDSTDGALEVNMAKNLTDLDSATFGSGDTTTTVSKDGVTVKNGDKEVSLTAGGLQVNGGSITNVADGIDDSDVATKDQLLGAVEANAKQRLARVQNDISQLRREGEAATASAGAMASLPQVYIPGKSLVAMATAGYRNEQGYALGASAITDNGRWVIKGSVSGNNRGHYMYGAGAGYVAW